MTTDELMQRIEQTLRTNYAIVQKRLPYKTGNLAYNAFQIIKIDDEHYDIKIDLSVAPYAEYIDRPGYRTFGYWDRAIGDMIKQITADLGGTLE